MIIPLVIRWLFNRNTRNFEIIIYQLIYITAWNHQLYNRHNEMCIRDRDEAIDTTTNGRPNGIELGEEFVPFEELCGDHITIKIETQQFILHLRLSTKKH